MNNLIAGILCIFPFLLDVCNADLPPSQEQILQLQNGDSKFFDKYRITNPLLHLTLIKYRAAAVSKNVDYLHSIRPDSYKKVVSREVFETQLLNNVKMPKNILYSENNSTVTNDIAKLSAYYFQNDGPFNYIVTSCDHWKFDKKNKQWSLVSNSLSWGSSIVK